jgi:aromatic-L-amino-acid decarboxylase
VDAAHGGAVALVPERRDVLAGCERADSLVVNPHKWMFVPLDFSVLFTPRKEVLRRAFSVVPEYLRNYPGERAENRMDYGVTLGRRFRALKPWFVIRAFGADGLAARVREHLRLAAGFAAAVDADPRFERLAPVPMSTVCFRARPSEGPGDGAELDAYNERLLAAVNEGGETFLTHTRLAGRFAIRMVVSGLRTEERHVDATWERIRVVERRLAEEAR